MDNSVEVNRDVNIVAYYFHNRGNRLKCFPKKMEYDGRNVVFTETGLRYPTKKGQKMVHVFDMTDGQADYRLEFDAEVLDWKLVRVSDAIFGTAA